MARLNNDAREILCDMVYEKAEDKRKQLTERLKSYDEVVAIVNSFQF